MSAFLFIFFSYILGSLPFGLLVTRLTKHIDIREHGSGNTGMTNVLRSVGIWPALVVLILDVGKGFLAVFLALKVYSSPSLEVLSGLAVLAGHNWSIFLKFQGGKGTATGFGVLCGLSPMTSIGVLVVCIPILVVFRYVSLGSIIGAISSFCIMLTLVLFGTTSQLSVPSLIYLLYPCFGAQMILFKHRGNISRLLNGTEPKLGGTAKARTR